MFRRYDFIFALLVVAPGLGGCAGSPQTTPVTVSTQAIPATVETQVQQPTPTEIITQSAAIPFDTPDFVPPTAPPTPSPTQTPVVLLDEDLSQKEFVLRQLPPDFTERFERPYPDEITQLADDELQGFRCTRTYIDLGYTPVHTLEYLDEAARDKYPMTDAALIKIAASLGVRAEATKQYVSALTYCETTAGLAFVMYAFSHCIPSAGGCFGNAYVGTVDTGEVTRIADVGDQDIPYMTCQVPLAVDKDNHLYYRCSGADGGGAGAAIFKVNLVSKEQTRLLSCDSEGRDITCE